MPNAATAGHGALIALELDPVGAAGTFTTVAELNGDISTPGLMRTPSESTPHQATIDRFVMGVMRREELTFSINFVPDHATHDAETGIQYLIINNVEHGLRLRGPGSTGPTDEMIFSGFFSSFKVTNPVREGVRTAECSWRPSGPMKIDGTITGADIV